MDRQRRKAAKHCAGILRRRAITRSGCPSAFRGSCRGDRPRTCETASGHASLEAAECGKLHSPRRPRRASEQKRGHGIRRDLDVVPAARSWRSLHCDGPAECRLLSKFATRKGAGTIERRFAGGVPSSYDKESRSVEAVLSKGSAVKRAYGTEVLKIDANSVKLDRLRAGGISVLDSRTINSASTMRSAGYKRPGSKRGSSQMMVRLRL